MPIYSFACPECGLRGDKLLAMDDRDAAVECPDCCVGMTRVQAMFKSKMPMEGHFNATVGAYVSSESKFNDMLKVQSEERTKRTGIEHNFVSHDPREMKDALAVTDEGLDATRRARKEAGLLTDEDVMRRHRAARALPRNPGPEDAPPEAADDSSGADQPQTGRNVRSAVWL